MMDSYLSILPSELARAVRALPLSERLGLRELRLRCGQYARYLSLDSEQILPAGSSGYFVDSECIREIVNRATRYSAYASSAQLRQGFVTLAGGHRLGVCGQAVRGPEGIRSLRDLSSVNLRIARQPEHIESDAVEYMRAHPDSTLIAGPPGCGKTTLLRELIRDRSDWARERVGVVDERMELAACAGGMPGFSVGQMTDVLSGVQKDEGVYMLLRTMSPQWIAVDEITEDRDVDALLRSSFCGVRLLASAHAFSRSDLFSRPLYARMCALGLFDHLIMMDIHHRTTMERMKENDQVSGSGAGRRGGEFGGAVPGAQRSA